VKGSVLGYANMTQDATLSILWFYGWDNYFKLVGLSGFLMKER
jgi:hypothetical protein